MKRCRHESSDLLDVVLLHTAITSIHLTRYIFLKSEFLSFHSELIGVTLTYSLHRTTAFLNHIPTLHLQRTNEIQLLFNSIENNLIVITFRKISLVYSKQNRTRMSNKSRIHEKIIQRSIHHFNNTVFILLSNFLHIIVTTINHVYNSSCLRKLLVDLTTVHMLFSIIHAHGSMSGNINEFSDNTIFFSFSQVRFDMGALNRCGIFLN